MILMYGRVTVLLLKMVYFHKYMKIAHEINLWNIMLDRQQLEMVRAIDRFGTVTKASEHLCLTQSALSHAIKKLEQRVGIQLWRKSGRTLLLTDAGSHVLQAANKILPQFDRFESELEALKQGFVGSLKLGIECYPCFQWLLQVVSPYLSKYQNVDVDIKNEFQFGGMGALFAHEIDLLITPDPLLNKAIEYIPIFDYEQVLVVSNQHAFAQLDHILPEQLEDQVLFTYPVETSRLDVFNQFLLPAGRTVKQHKILENTEMILQLVEANRGVAVLPDWLVAKADNKEQIESLRLGPTGLHKSTFIAVRQGEIQSRFVNEFVELAKQQSA